MGANDKLAPGTTVGRRNVAADAPPIAPTREHRHAPPRGAAPPDEASRPWAHAVASALAASLALVACGGDDEPVVTSAPASVMVDRCPVFLEDNAWNTPIDHLPVHPDSDLIVDGIGRDEPLHPDFGAEWFEGPNGIPYTVVETNQPTVPIDFVLYGHESDPGPYPIPPDAPIEGGEQSDGDRHVIVLDRGSCLVYELYKAYPVDGGARWRADSGAIWDLTINDSHPLGYTSADAAGLPILPGLARYDEIVTRGRLDHALRFTTVASRIGYVLPATHFATTNVDAHLPAMGMRFRLKPGYDCNAFTGAAKTICRALKTYGIILADHGGTWFVSGVPDSRWDDDELRQLKEITGDDLELVDTGDVQLY